MPADEITQEAALSVAQSVIQNAMDATGIGPSELARRMGVHRTSVARMMSGGYNMTLRTFTLALSACGYRPTFGYTENTTTWAE